PVASDVQFPAHACQRRADQPVVDLARNRPAGAVELFPFCFKRGQRFPLLRDGFFRPIRRPARWPVDARDVVHGDWLVNGAPRPEVTREVVERVGETRERYGGKHTANEKMAHSFLLMDGYPEYAKSSPRACGPGARAASKPRRRLETLPFRRSSSAFFRF